jgi:hypothetical protein
MAVFGRATVRRAGRERHAAGSDPPFLTALPSRQHAPDSAVKGIYGSHDPNRVASAFRDRRVRGVRCVLGNDETVSVALGDSEHRVDVGAKYFSRRSHPNFWKLVTSTLGVPVVPAAVTIAMWEHGDLSDRSHGERPGRPRTRRQRCGAPGAGRRAARVPLAIIRTAHARNVTVDNEHGPERENHRHVA